MGTWKAEAGLQIPSSLGYIVVSVSKRNRKLRVSPMLCMESSEFNRSLNQLFILVRLFSTEL